MATSTATHIYNKEIGGDEPKDQYKKSAMSARERLQTGSFGNDKRDKLGRMGRERTALTIAFTLIYGYLQKFPKYDLSVRQEHGG